MITANHWFKMPFRLWESSRIVRWREKFLVADYGRVPEDDPPVMAQVFEGAWLVRCECGGAEYAWEEGLFWCFSCGNADHGHRIRRSCFPKKRKQIEVLLARRPLKNRNWMVGETPAGLKRENKEHADTLLPKLAAGEGGD